MRLRFFVEGQTEETFVNHILISHLLNVGVHAQSAQKITTGRRRGKVYKGGIVSYQHFIRELLMLMKEDTESVFTTMIDLYGLSDEYFPDGKRANAEAAENKILTDIESEIGKYPKRFIPYIQLHEFETLLLVSPLKIGNYFDNKNAAYQLMEDVRPFSNVENINLTPEGAPSKRIIRYFPSYEGSKATAGPTIISMIGLESVRKNCVKFDRWISMLEKIK